MSGVTRCILSTTIPTELMDLLKEKAEALRDCGIANVTTSSLAASFLASQREDIEDIEPEEIVAGLEGKDIRQEEAATFLHHLSMQVDAEVKNLLNEKVRAIRKAGCPSISLSSLTASFLMSQFDEISSLDPHEMARDMIAAGGEPDEGDREGANASQAAGDSEGGDSDEGSAAEACPPERSAGGGAEADEDSPGADEGDAGDEEVAEGKED